MYPTAVDELVAGKFIDDRAIVWSLPVRIVVAPAAPADWSRADRSRVPASWIDAMTRGSAGDAIAALGWPTVEPFLPRTVAELRDKLAGLGVMLADGKSPRLLYFFVADGQCFAFEGFPPAEGPFDLRPRPPNVATMQRLHDGWFEFFTGDLGPMPEEEWPVIGPAPSDGSTLIGIASKGSALAGFEPEAPGLPARVLWPADWQVETPEDLFETVDEWIALALESSDSQT